MEAIVNLDQLHHNLNLGPGFGGYSKLVKAVDFTPEVLRDIGSFSQDHYQRIRLYDSNLVEAILTCWEPGQIGKIHNFHHSMGWFKVIAGSIFLEHFKFKKGAPVVSYQSSYPETIQGFLNDDLGFHRFSNPHPKRAMVLFIYADKIKEWDVYNPKNGNVERRKAEVDFNLDLVNS